MTLRILHLTYAFGYAYDLSGALIEETYPSGRVVKNTLNADGELSQVQSKKNSNYGFFTYADAFSYNAAGAVSSMQLGNGRWESTQFNSRLQPTQIALGTVQNATDKLKLNYSYGDWNGTSIDATKNNGNIASQIITVPTVGSNMGFTATQTYTYDLLNRIQSATETISGTQTWKQTFAYDRYGNRTFDTTANRTTTIPTNCPTMVCNPSVDPATNKLVGYQFDSAGNTKTDAENRTFVYDAENKQVKVIGSSTTVGEYFYDGDGKRIKKIVPNGETVIFVYDAGGKLVAEYANQISQTPKVSYLTSDHLGSPRINMDENGATISRHDYHPFGEEITTPQRLPVFGYASDDIRKQFTGYERDNETDLDFAQARYFANNHGRFSSADPLMASGRPSNPQTWNRYTYVLNNPLRFIDPTGMSEQGGTKIVHQDRRPVIRIEDYTVLVTAEPSRTVPSKEYKNLDTGETVVRNVFDINVTLSDSSGRAVPDSAFTVQTVGLDDNGKPFASQSSTVERQPDGSLKTIPGPSTENYTAPGEAYTVTANTDGSDNTTMNVETGKTDADGHRSKITTGSSVSTVDFSTTRFNGTVSVDPAYDRALPAGPVRIEYVAAAAPASPARRNGVQTILIGDPLRR